MPIDVSRRDFSAGTLFISCHKTLDSGHARLLCSAKFAHGVPEKTAKEPRQRRRSVQEKEER